VCQTCVNEGRMTAAELAEALAAGDLGAVAMVALEPPEFLVALALTVEQAIQLGTPLDEALEIGRECIALYCVIRPGVKRTVDALLAEIRTL
jgi:hypothetical protein